MRDAKAELLKEQPLKDCVGCCQPEAAGKHKHTIIGHKKQRSATRGDRLATAVRVCSHLRPPPQAAD